VAGGLRNPNSAFGFSIDGAGNVYVVWSDCRFRTELQFENDIVMSTSAEWDHMERGDAHSHRRRRRAQWIIFIPGIGVDPTTSGSSAHVTIVYYYYPVSNCSSTTCQLEVGFTTSTDGGATWTAGVKLAGPMKLAWLPVSDDGPMVADYIGVILYKRQCVSECLRTPQAPTGSTLAEAMYTTKSAHCPAPGSAPTIQWD
jgi:hypothetical protein